MKELSSLDGGSKKKSSSKHISKPVLKTGNKRDFRAIYAFLITLALYAVAALLCNKYPLGQYSFLQSDLKGQYAPFLALLRSKIYDMGSVPQDHFFSYLTYSFKLGLGKNLMSTFGYYLASPFNILYLFIDEAQIDAAVLLIVVLKLSLASGFMCLFLGKRNDDKKSLWPVLLGICYAFSLYSQAFIFQIMWLDGFMLLPLILYFTEKYIKDQKYLGLVISLLVLFISNYYIAYMVGIASFLYLIVRLFAVKTPIKKAVGIAIRYVLVAGFTALITAVILVPVGIDTIGNSDQSISSRGENVLTYSPLTLIHFFLSGEPGEFSDVLPSNFPFLFICIPVSIMLLIYFISPVFEGRERKIHLCCLIGVLLSTVLYPIDKAWQVFDDPNWFWHRQAFVFLPLFLVISIKVLLRLKDVMKKDILKAMIIMIMLVAIDISFGRMKGDTKAALYNIVLIICYSAILAGYGVTNWPDQLRDMPKMLSPILSGIICFELIYVGPMLSSNIETMTLFGGPAEEYSDSIRAERQFGDFAKSRNKETGGFRAEGENAPSYTDKFYSEEGQAFYGDYNGLSFFNSNSNKRMHRFIKQLGLTVNYNYFTAGHSFACPSVDAFFSISAISSRRNIALYHMNGSDSYESGLNFYENDEVLPLGFAVDKNANDFDFYRLELDINEKNYFSLQNDWYSSMFPEYFSKEFFIDMDGVIVGEPEIRNGVYFNASEYMTNEEFIAKNDPESEPQSFIEDPLGLEGKVYYDLKDNLTDIYRINSNIPIAVEYNFEAASTDEIYCSLVGGRVLDETEVYVNGMLIDSFSSNTYYSRIFRIGSFEEGERVKVTFLSNSDKWSYLNIRFASFDTEAFSEQFALIDKSKVSTELVYDGYVKFDINDLGTDDMVLTTIPAEDGWQLYIDGNPADFKVYQNAFIAFDAGQGSHTAELVFTAPGLKAGALVSCIGLAGLAAFIFIDKKLSKMKEKQ